MCVNIGPIARNWSGSPSCSSPCFSVPSSAVPLRPCFGTSMTASAFIQVSFGNQPVKRCLVTCGMDRRDVLLGGLCVTLAAVLPVQSVDALVKGSTPPKDFGKREPRERVSDIAKAREIGESRETELFGDGTEDFKVGADGDRYRDLVVGSGQPVTNGSQVDIRYRVLKTGKRSPDGLGGEGSLVFSLGYGEDDDKPGDFLTIKVGDDSVVKALNNTIVGMKEGGIRRIRVLPERGWRRSKGCEKTIDVGVSVGLPGASVTEVESCMDSSLLPKPTTFQAKRKFSRRFDGTLVLEVEAVKVSREAP